MRGRIKIYAVVDGKQYEVTALKQGSPCFRCPLEVPNCIKERTRHFPCDGVLKAVQAIGDGNFRLKEVRRG